MESAGSVGAQGGEPRQGRPRTISGWPLTARLILTAIALLMAAVVLAMAEQWFLALLMVFFLVFIVLFTTYYWGRKE